MRVKLFFFSLFFAVATLTSAQNEYGYVVPTTHSDQVRAAFADSLREMRASYYAYFRMWEDPLLPMPRGILPDPNLYKLFVPPTFYVGPIEQAFNIDWQPGMHQPNAVDTLYAGKATVRPTFEARPLDAAVKADRWVNRILLQYYLAHPERLVNNELFIAGLKPLEQSHVVTAPREEKIKSYLDDGNEVKNLDAESELLVVRPNFWTHRGNAYAQFTQHFISKNWYKGGESTNALLSGFMIEANFDDRERLEFENKLEMKLGFITAPSDTAHRYKTNADLLRVSSKLGVKAVKNWYYTLAAEFKTQFFANYKTNTSDMISNFLTPAQLDVTLGMDYKRSGRNYNLSFLTSPFAYSFIYLNSADRIINRRSFNVSDGKTHAHLFGSKFSGNWRWTFMKNITWESKFEYFTTYKTVIANWENTFNFALNRYLSTKLFIHGRFDDGVQRSDSKTSYFQLQEVLSFGLNYNF